MITINYFHPERAENDYFVTLYRKDSGLLEEKLINSLIRFP